MIRTQTGDFGGVIADYQNALGLRPVFAQAYVGLAMVYIRKDDSEKAIQVLEDFTSQIENSGKKRKDRKRQPNCRYDCRCSSTRKYKHARGTRHGHNK